MGFAGADPGRLVSPAIGRTGTGPSGGGASAVSGNASATNDGSVLGCRSSSTLSAATSARSELRSARSDPVHKKVLNAKTGTAMTNTNARMASTNTK